MYRSMDKINLASKKIIIIKSLPLQHLRFSMRYNDGFVFIFISSSSDTRKNKNIQDNLHKANNQ